MAPTQVLMSDIIFQKVMIAGAVVKALKDSGATTLWCSRYWYKRYHAEIGPLLQDLIHVIGMGNTAIYIDGRTDRPLLKWGRAVTSVSLLVIPTLEGLDEILCMDALQRLDVKIDTRAGIAEQTLVAPLIRPQETWRIPARKSVVFAVKNPFMGLQRNVLFEPSEKLPTTIRGTTSLGKGNKIYIYLENTSEDEQVLNPEWEIGTAEVVDEEPDLPRVEIDEVGLPVIPDELSPRKKKGIRGPTNRIQGCLCREGVQAGERPGH